MQGAFMDSICDIRGLKIGHAHDHQLRSGVSVLSADAPFLAAVDIRGGAPGTRETDLLAPDKLVNAVDAIVLSGGSAFGLAAADGVMQCLAQEGRGFPTSVKNVPIVPSAIIFDLANGGNKDFDAHCYYQLGQAAYADLKVQHSSGRIGAGYGAMTGCGQGGIGSASLRLEGGIIVAALVVVNAFGQVTNAKGEYFGAPYALEGEMDIHAVSRVQPELISQKLQGFDAPRAENTSIGIIATNAKLDKAQAQRLATVAHDGYALAIRPAHSLFDGDLIFGLSTEEIAIERAGRAELEIANAASLVMARAVMRGVYWARRA